MDCREADIAEVLVGPKGALHAVTLTESRPQGSAPRTRPRDDPFGIPGSRAQVRQAEARGEGRSLEAEAATFSHGVIAEAGTRALGRSCRS